MSDGLHIGQVHRPLPTAVDADVLFALEPLTSQLAIDLLVPPSADVSSPLPLVTSLLEEQLGFRLVDWKTYAAVAGVRQEAASPSSVCRLLVSSASSSLSGVCCVVWLSPVVPCHVRVFASSISQCAAFLVRLQAVLAASGLSLVEDAVSGANLSAAGSLLSSLTREAELAVSGAVTQTPHQPCLFSSHSPADVRCVSPVSPNAAVVDGAARWGHPSVRRG